MMLVVVLSLMTKALFAAEQKRHLQHNPFKGPTYLSAEGRTSSVLRIDGSAQLDLRATISAGKDSLINMGGKFYSVGDDIDGFQLLTVGEGQAVFIKDGKRVTVTLNEDMAVE